MPCQILVENLVGTTGDISVIVPNTHVWTHNETLVSWRIKYPNRDLSEFHRNFSLIIVSDKSPEDIGYLTGVRVVDNTPTGVSWTFKTPQTTSEEWRELYTTGQITKTFSEVQPYLVEYP